MPSLKPAFLALRKRSIVIAKLLVFTLIVLVIRVFPQGLFTMQRR